MFAKFFKGSFAFTFIAVVVGFFLGAGADMNIALGLKTVFIVLVLGILEISLSFDNAVVNASVLEEMPLIWQKRFLTWGIAIAVFGMRIIFPLVIVAIVGHINPWAALRLAIINPDQYAQILTSSHIILAGFGGTFLFMVALKFFVNIEKENHFIGPIERMLKRFGELKSAEMLITLFVLLGVSATLPSVSQFSFLIAGIWGVVVYSLVDGFSELLKKRKESLHSLASIGFSLFMYLEILDASFSFDGVIGAFALSKNIFIIALGLGIGAMFVRSLTIMLVRKGTLHKYAYLEHGAFWAILTLAIIMFISTQYEVPEVLTGLLGASIIGIAMVASLWKNKQEDEIHLHHTHHPEQHSEQHSNIPH